jgi:hypothetical protein
LLRKVTMFGKRNTLGKFIQEFTSEDSATLGNRPNLSVMAQNRMKTLDLVYGYL